MRITVLGKSPAWQDADGACSGYLVEGGGQTVLLDCGPGVFAKLRAPRRLRRRRRGRDQPPARRPHPRSGAVRLRAALRAAPAAGPVDGHPGTDHPARPRLFAPPGALEAFAGMSSATGMTADHIEVAFDVTVYDPADTVTLGGLTARFQPVPHFIPANAVELAGGRRALHVLRRLRAQRGAVRVRRRHRPAADRGDAAAARARRPARAPDARARRVSTARKAEAKRLVLTHFSDELDADWARAEGRARAFGAPVDLAREGCESTSSRQ